MSKRAVWKNAFWIILCISLSSLLILSHSGVKEKIKLLISKPQPSRLASPGAIDSSLDEQVMRKISQMTMEEKVGQIMMVYFQGPALSAWFANQLKEVHPGGVILYDSTGNIEDPGQVMDLTEAIQQEAARAGGIPLFIGIDQEGGWIQRFPSGVTRFPGNMALGATGSEKLTQDMARVTADELRVMGINVNFAPVIDIATNPDNPIIGPRSFGSDPQNAARLGAAMVKAYQQAGVVCSLKHFPGHGDVA